MNRRKYILGVGALGASSTVALGSGAFSAAQVRDRDANIDVVNDSNALIGLIPNSDISGVQEDDDGELAIEVEDNGVNVNSIYQFGYFASGKDDPTDDDFELLVDDDPTQEEGDSFKSAFLVANQTDAATDVQLDIESDENGLGDTEVMFEIHQDGERVEIIEQPGDNVSATANLDPGEAFGVSFVVNSLNGGVGDEFAAELTVTAGEGLEEETDGPVEGGVDELDGVTFKWDPLDDGLFKGTISNDNDYDVLVTIWWPISGEDGPYEVGAGETKTVHSPLRPFDTESAEGNTDDEPEIVAVNSDA